HGRMHHDVVGADRLRVPGEIDDGAEILIRARQDRAMPAQPLDRSVEAWLALGDRHGEELALLAADENAVDAEIVDPVAQVPAQTRLIDRQVGRKRRQRRRPNALEMLAGVILGLASAVVHRVPFPAGFSWGFYSRSAWASPGFSAKPRDAPIVRLDRAAKSACRMLAATLARRASPIYDVRHVGLQRRRERGIVRRLVCGALSRR